MVLRLAECLEVPLRERNALLLAAGFAPVFPDRSFEDPGLASVRAAVEAVLHAHMPFPALAIDRRWILLASNAALAPLLEGPVNVLRISLHPDGVAPRIANLAEWRGHILSRLRRQLAESGDAELADLIRELAGYPGGEAPPRAGEGAIAAPLRLKTPTGELSFLSATMGRRQGQQALPREQVFQRLGREAPALALFVDRHGPGLQAEARAVLLGDLEPGRALLLFAVEVDDARDARLVAGVDQQLRHRMGGRMRGLVDAFANQAQRRSG